MNAPFLLISIQTSSLIIRVSALPSHILTLLSNLFKFIHRSLSYQKKHQCPNICWLRHCGYKVNIQAIFLHYWRSCLLMYRKQEGKKIQVDSMYPFVKISNYSYDLTLARLSWFMNIFPAIWKNYIANNAVTNIAL